MIGKNLAHYEVTDLLGKGGMGEVYRARDTKLKRDVALKILPADTAADPARLDRFQREAEAIAGLTHPNVVTLHSLEEDAGVRFITMELVDGLPLNELLGAGMSLPDLLEIGEAVASALQAAHERGIIHRDLKPTNVMLTRDGRAKVLDFGLAKLAYEKPTTDMDATEAADLTREGSVLGTIPYMSPEQLRGRNVDKRSDIFSLGVLLYELATGQRPFRGDTDADVISAILRETPPPITQLRDNLPPFLEQIITRCLEKEADHRFQSADEVGSALHELKRQTESGGIGESVTGSGLGAAEPSKGRGGLWATLAAVVVVIAVTAFYLGRGDQPTGQRTSGGTATETAGTGTPAKNSIAVMAFADMSPDRDQEYFADGIAEELLNLLARIPDLKVISRTSSFSYKDKEVPLAQVASELGVAHILEGSVRMAGSRVRITAQLIDAPADTPLWTETYDRELHDIFAIQDEIAADVVAHLKLTLLGEGRNFQKTSDGRPTDNLDAYQAYLRGLERFNAVGFSRESFELGVQMFERAVALDPEFALAYARLSSMNSRLFHYGYDRTPERLQRARTAADRALALAPDLAEAHLALAHYYYWGVKDYDRALDAMDAALENAPNMGELLLTTAYVKRRQGAFASAIEFFQQYRELSPRDANGYIGLGETFGTMRRYDEAKQALDRALVLAPDEPYPYTELALLNLRRNGNAEAARSVLSRMPPTGSSEPCRVGYLVELLDREYDAALARIDACTDTVMEASAFYTPTGIPKGHVHRLQKQPELARAAFAAAQRNLEQKLRDVPDDARIHAALGIACAGLGRRDEAVSHGRRAVELYPLARDALDAPVQIINLALIYTMLGEYEAALDQLDKALSIPSVLSVAWLRVDPRWDGLRENSRFEELLDRHTP